MILEIQGIRFLQFPFESKVDLYPLFDFPLLNILLGNIARASNFEKKHDVFYTIYSYVYIIKTSRITYKITLALENNGNEDYISFILVYPFLSQLNHRYTSARLSNIGIPDYIL